MPHEFSRTEMLIGPDALSTLRQSRVAVFGIGGVGSYVVEGLARAGIGHFLLVDNDTVSLTNINRQLIALHSTLGRPKVEVARERILDINPSADVETCQVFVLPDLVAGLIRPGLDYVVDAIDTVAAKVELAVQAEAAGVPLISCMGAGNKLDATGFAVTDLYRTTGCPLAKVMRRELKKRGVASLKVVFSPEAPLAPGQADPDETVRKRRIPGSVSFVPSIAGLIIAGEVIKDLIGFRSGDTFSGPGCSPQKGSP
jgi:tRNA threonylcarbamoyladenosine dehydratase